MIKVRRWSKTILAAAIAVAAVNAIKVADVNPTAAAAQPPAPTPDALVARLAVLRRPQTPADLLPPGTRLHGSGGRILPGLTRLVATLPGPLNVYLVVVTPTGGSRPLWSPRLGDQLTLVAAGSGAAAFDQPYPAADLNDPFRLGSAGNLRLGGPLRRAYHVAILPDGVSRVRWRFAKPSGGREAVQTATVTNNVAVAPLTRPQFLLDGATWYAPNGATVPTSDAALVRALAAQDAIQKASAIRAARRHSRRAAPSLLAAFAVFSVNSRRPVREPGGITVARPRLTDVPFTILQLISHGPTPLDDGQIRAIVTRAGDQMWVIPGVHGMCLAVMDPPLSASPFSGQGGGGSCGGNLAQAEADGVGLQTGDQSGSVTYDVLPKSKPTITVKIHGHRRVIHLPFGVYVLRHSRHHHGNNTVVVSPAGGQV